jgi:hypothetical protein
MIVGSKIVVHQISIAGRWPARPKGDNMKNKLPESFLILVALWAVLIFGNGCASTAVTMQTNKDPGPMHAVKRLFVVINLGPLENQTSFNRGAAEISSASLAEGLRGCFSTNGVQLEIKVVNPLELEKPDYAAQAREFFADAALLIRLDHYVVDQFGNYPMLYYDAALSNEVTHKLVWRALIKNSGNPGTMKERNQRMAESIVAKLRADGFLETE